MAYCRNCGCELPADSKFCNQCGTSTGIPTAPDAPAASGRYNLGAEVSVYYYSQKMKNHSIFTTCFVNIGLFVILLLLGFVPLPGVITTIGWIFLIVDTIWQVISIACMDKNMLRIHEHGVHVVQANGPFVSEFDLSYDEITRANALVLKTWTSVEQIQIFAHQRVYASRIRDPRTAVAEMERISGRTLI